MPVIDFLERKKVSKERMHIYPIGRQIKIMLMATEE